MGLSDRVSLGHVSIEVSSLARARRFYDRFLPILGFRRLPGAASNWLGYRKAGTSLWLTVSRPPRIRRKAPRVPTTGVNEPISEGIGFRAPSPKRVAELEVALRRVGLRPVYATSQQAAHGPAWYTSNAWKDSDHNVLEIYSLSARRRVGIGSNDQPKTPTGKG
jgi:catechol 2,3-dioxygenase-like lactoylglutathione lyase family enzyme